jgi:hypothetical protein
VKKRLANNWYPLLVWLLTVIVIGPTVSSIVMKFLGITVIQEARDLKLNFRVFLVFGLFFSIPVFVIYFVIFKILTYKNKSILFVKTCLNTICTIGIFITFYIMSASTTNMYFSLVYTVSAIISSFVFNVYSQRGDATVNKG